MIDQHDIETLNQLFEAHGLHCETEMVVTVAGHRVKRRFILVICVVVGGAGAHFLLDHGMEYVAQSFELLLSSAIDVIFDRCKSGVSSHEQ